MSKILKLNQDYLKYEIIMRSWGRYLSKSSKIKGKLKSKYDDIFLIIVLLMGITSAIFLIVGIVYEKALLALSAFLILPLLLFVLIFMDSKINYLKKKAELKNDDYKNRSEKIHLKIKNTIEKDIDVLFEEVNELKNDNKIDVISDGLLEQIIEEKKKTLDKKTHYCNEIDEINKKLSNDTEQEMAVIQNF